MEKVSAWCRKYNNNNNNNNNLSCALDTKSVKDKEIIVKKREYSHSEIAKYIRISITRTRITRIPR